MIFRETDPGEEASEDTREQWSFKDADIKRCWVKYGLQVLDSSRDALMEQVANFDDNYDLDGQQNGVKAEGASPSHNDDKKGASVDHNSDKRENVQSNDTLEDEDSKKFEPFNLEVTSFEEKVTDEKVKNFDEARLVFLFVQDLISKAKEVYTIDSHCTDFIELTQDHSKAFKLLAFFELDMERQCRMHKRRIDMLLALLNQVCFTFLTFCLIQIDTKRSCIIFQNRFRLYR